MHTKYNRLQTHKHKVPAGLNAIIEYNTNTNIIIGYVPAGGAIYTKSNKPHYTQKAQHMHHNSNSKSYSTKTTKASSNRQKTASITCPLGKNYLSKTAEWNVSSEPAANMMHYFLLPGNNYSRAMYVARQLSFGGNNSRPRNASIKLFWWHVKIYAHLIHTHDQNQADLQLVFAKAMPHELVKCSRTQTTKTFSKFLQHFQNIQA